MEDVDRQVHDACSSATPQDDMAEFVNWATDIYMKFLYQHPTLYAERATWGLKTMASVRDRLKAKTSEVHKTIKDEDWTFEEETALRKMHFILREFLDRINEHHKQIPMSRIGVDEVRRLGQVTDFVRIGTVPVQSTRSLYEMSKSLKLPMFWCLEAMEHVIEGQLKERDHPMPVEFALNTLAPAIPKLNPAILRRLPLKIWSEWFEASRLEPIFEKLEADVTKQLESAPASQLTSGAMSPPTMYTARSRQTSVVGSQAESHGAMITKAVQTALDQEPAASSLFDTLFDSASQAPKDLQNIQSAPPENPFPKLILPGYAAKPAPVPQGRAPKTAFSVNQLPDQLAHRMVSRSHQTPRRARQRTHPASSAQRPVI